MPATVSRTPWRSRSNNSAPISVSSRLMAMLSGGWVMSQPLGGLAVVQFGGQHHEPLDLPEIHRESP